MTTVQIIKTQSGDEMVVLSRAEYDALLLAVSDAEEDASDAAVFDARMALLSVNLQDTLPPEVSMALLKGDRLAKALRHWRGLTQVSVAKAAKIQQGYLSDIENGRRKGTVETLDALAKALDVPAHWLS
jgi:DNA-binding XRE family transcriptional regulator